MTFSGDLSVLQPAMVLQFTNSANLTGLIKFIAVDRVGDFYLKHGELIHASLMPCRFRLGQFLVERGLITEDQRAGALNTYRHERGYDRIGNILVARGYIRQYDLEHAIKEQMREVVYDVVSWEQGCFTFFPDVEPRKEDVLLDVSLDHLILEGMRRIDEERRERKSRPKGSPLPEWA